MLLLLFCALLIGIGLPVQAGVNAQLRTGVGHPLLASFISFLVGTVALLGLNLALRVPLPGSGDLSRIPWWHWAGGLLGAAYIYGAIILAPRLGAGTLIAVTVAGQMIAALALDQFGLVGYPQQAVTPARLLGALLVIGGVFLVQRR